MSEMETSPAEVQSWRCDDCGAPESLLERGLFFMEGFRESTGHGGFVQPDSWYCDLCFWQARDDYDQWLRWSDDSWHEAV